MRKRGPNMQTKKRQDPERHGGDTKQSGSNRETNNDRTIPKEVETEDHLGKKFSKKKTSSSTFDRGHSSRQRAIWKEDHASGYDICVHGQRLRGRDGRVLREAFHVPDGGHRDSEGNSEGLEVSWTKRDHTGCFFTAIKTLSTVLILLCVCWYVAQCLTRLLYTVL